MSWVHHYRWALRGHKVVSLGHDANSNESLHERKNPCFLVALGQKRETKRSYSCIRVLNLEDKKINNFREMALAYPKRQNS
jgi:hypothetical protein